MKSSGAPVTTRPYRMGARADAARATADRVLAGAIELFTEKPYEAVSLDEVADRGRVTKRTVLRRFGSKEALFVAAMQRAADEMMSHRNTAPVGDVAGAVANLMDHYERWGTNRLRMLSEEELIPVIAEHVEGGRRFHRSWVERTFGASFDNLSPASRRRRIIALIALTDVYTWKLLRRDLRLGRTETERILVESISTLKGES